MRIDFILLLFAAYGSYKSVSYNAFQLRDSLIPLLIIVLMILSKRTVNGRGISGGLAFILTTLFFVSHWMNLQQSSNLNFLPYACLIIPVLIFRFTNITTYFLTITWTVYYALLLIFLATNQEENMQLFISSPLATDLIIVSNSSILLLSIIASLLVDMEIRARTRTSL